MNKTFIQYFQWYVPKDGTFWKKFQADVPRLRQLGITAAWLPPAYKGLKGSASEGYDVYDLYDLGEFDQKGTVATGYGSLQDYAAACKTAQQEGLEIVIDVVLNHKGGGDDTETVTVRRVDPENRNHYVGEPEQIETYTKFTFPGRNGRHSTFTWDHTCFSGVDRSAGTDPDSNKEVIYALQNGHDTPWSTDVNNTQKGNFDYLLLCDIDFRNPQVQQEMKDWIRWYYHTVPFNGVRLDAVKHISYHFFNEWLDFLRTEVNPDIYAIGEYWLSDDLQVLLEYIDHNAGRMSLFDAPLHHNFAEASRHGAAFDLRTILDNSLVLARPSFAITFADNHDTQPLQSLEEWVETWFKVHAYAIILLRKDGTPCVFYGDLYGARYNDRNKSGYDCCVQLPPMTHLPLLVQLRSTHAYGTQRDYFAKHHLIGWTREGHTGQRNACAVVLSNDRAGAILMYVGIAYAGTTFTDALGNSPETVVINEEGCAAFPVQARSVSVWIPAGG
jgi:alpha-amylase